METNLTTNDISTLVIMARTSSFMTDDENIKYISTLFHTEYSQLIAWLVLLKVTGKTAETSVDIIGKLKEKGLLKSPSEYGAYVLSKAQEAAKTIIKMA